MSSKDECQSAAELLRLQDTVPAEEGRSGFPAGCFKGVDSQLYFHAGEGSEEEDDWPDVRAICAWGTTTATPTTSRCRPPPDNDLGYRGSCKPDAHDSDHFFIPERETSHLPLSAVPNEFDARYVWPYCFDGNFSDSASVVRAQGACGSCWAFATSSVARHRACIHDCKENGRCDETNAMFGRHLSVQQIMGCGSSRSGCDGGLAFQAYESMVEAVAWEADVAYQCSAGRLEDQFDGPGDGACREWPWATEPGSCDLDLRHVDVKSYFRLPLGGALPAAEVMAAELATNGPLAVDFCVRDNIFSFWSVDPTRIYMEEDGCKHGDVVGGHMAMLVGFGRANQRGREVPYWTVQNSWSDTWAHDGYFYMERGVNLCGIENKASAVEVEVSPVLPPSGSTTATTSTTEEATTTTTTLEVTSTPLEGSSSEPLITPAAEDLDHWEVPMNIFLLVAALLLLLFVIAAGIACLIWYRHNKLRQMIRSERPGFFDDIMSRNQRRSLSQHRGGMAWQPPVVMGNPVSGSAAGYAVAQETAASGAACEPRGDTPKGEPRGP